MCTGSNFPCTNSCVTVKQRNVRADEIVPGDFITDYRGCEIVRYIVGNVSSDEYCTCTLTYVSSHGPNLVLQWTFFSETTFLLLNDDR